MNNTMLKRLALGTSALVALTSAAGQAQAQTPHTSATTLAPVPAAQPAFAPAARPAANPDLYCVQDQPTQCAATIEGAVALHRAVRHHAAPANTEGDILRPRTSASPFKISVDGRTVAGDGFDFEAAQRATDVALAATDIQVRSDGLDVVPALNVGLVNDAVTLQRGAPMVFEAYSNYEAFIARAEVRLFEATQSYDDEPLMVVPVDERGRAASTLPAAMPDDLVYLLRVYDAEGRYDETIPKPVAVVNQPEHATPLDGVDAHHGVIGGWGVDRTLSRTIDVRGGAITVNGVHVPQGHQPVVLGRTVPVDSEGKFAVQQILPFGDQRVDVSVTNAAGQGVSFQRDVHIRDTEFFYVALGDITLGQRGAVGPADLTAASDEDFDEVVVNGRGAFYLKGKVRGRYLITAAMDTGEARIKDIFRNLDDKDPRQLLRRLDADRFYPVYGDDSTTREDAPTQGRFYVRVDDGDSHIMWGNFATQVTGTEFAQLDRGLYGGVADYNSESLTEFGERKTEATAFVADPGTIPGRDEFRGTGGSLYFLQRQDISIGSERLRIELRDKVSGLVLETRELRPQEDYDIDYIQGRVILSEPLQSTVYDGEVVRDGGLSGDEAFLVARYEFTPGLSDIDGYTVGGRATHWVGDHVRLGVTAQNEETAGADQELLGADILLRHSNNTFIKAEIAQTEGPGFSETRSTDGGFIFDDVATPGAAGLIAKAYRLEVQADLDEINTMFNDLDTRIRAIIEHNDAGFSGVGTIGGGEQDRISLGLDTKLGAKTELDVEYDALDSARRGKTEAVNANIAHKFDEAWSVRAGVRHDSVDRSAQATQLSPNRRDFDGDRTDVSAEVAYRSSEDLTLRAFAQGTVDRDGGRRNNDRVGVGGDVRLSDRFNLSGEVSEGSGGMGANAQLTFQRDEDTEVYLGYGLSTDRSDTALAAAGERYGNTGTITAGGRKRFNDALSVYGEEQFAYDERSEQLSHTYGLEFRPDEHWTLGASIENGTITDEIDGDFERTAFSVSASHSRDGLRMASQLETRFEDGELQGRNRDRTTVLLRNTLAFDANKDVEALARLNIALSDSDQSSLQDAEYVEGVAALAYRPVANDRFNALAKYTYFEDMSPPDQRSATGQTRLARQRSQVLSLDAELDVNERLTVGGKVGLRRGEVALDRGSDVFVKSDAWLGVARAEMHIIREWEAMAEARILESQLADDRRVGALAGVYRHVSDNMKVGAGYSFSEFSDDLTDFSDDADGFFVNVVGKF